MFFCVFFFNFISGSLTMTAGERRVTLMIMMTRVSTCPSPTQYSPTQHPHRLCSEHLSQCSTHPRPHRDGNTGTKERHLKQKDSNSIKSPQTRTDLMMLNVLYLYIPRVERKTECSLIQCQPVFIHIQHTCIHILHFMENHQGKNQNTR